MPKVLLIDDSRTIHKVAALILKGSVFKLLTAENSEEGERMVLQEKPEVALVDFTLKPLNGLDLIRKFSKNPQLKQMKKALLYGHFQKIDDQSLTECGAEGKLSKPFDSQEFLKLVEDLTNLRTETVSQMNNVFPPSVEEKKPGTSPRTSDDEFKSLFEDAELEECLNFLEKPLTPMPAVREFKESAISVPTKIPTVISSSDDSLNSGNRSQGLVSRDVVEKVCREVVGPLAEKIIREEIQKLLKETE